MPTSCLLVPTTYFLKRLELAESLVPRGAEGALFFLTAFGALLVESATGAETGCACGAAIGTTTGEETGTTTGTVTGTVGTCTVTGTITVGEPPDVGGPTGMTAGMIWAMVVAAKAARATTILNIVIFRFFDFLWCKCVRSRFAD